MSKLSIRTALLGLVVAGLAVLGCGQADDKGKPKGDTPKEAKKDGRGEEKGKHEGYWCDEHGVPEAECSLCSPKVEKEAKAKGDWCEKHNRALSQCFHCKPERRAFYAAKHKAREGKEPPPIPEFDEKKGKKDK